MKILQGLALSAVLTACPTIRGEQRVWRTANKICVTLRQGAETSCNETSSGLAPGPPRWSPDGKRFAYLVFGDSALLKIRSLVIGTVSVEPIEFETLDVPEAPQFRYSNAQFPIWFGNDAVAVYGNLGPSASQVIAYSVETKRYLTDFAGTSFTASPDSLKFAYLRLHPHFYPQEKKSLNVMVNRQLRWNGVLRGRQSVLDDQRSDLEWSPDSAKVALAIRTQQTTSVVVTPAPGVAFERELLPGDDNALMVDLIWLDSKTLVVNRSICLHLQPASLDTCSATKDEFLPKVNAQLAARKERDSVDVWPKAQEPR